MKVARSINIVCSKKHGYMRMYIMQTSAQIYACMDVSLVDCPSGLLGAKYLRNPGNCMKTANIAL